MTTLLDSSCVDTDSLSEEPADVPQRGGRWQHRIHIALGLGLLAALLAGALASAAGRGPAGRFFSVPANLSGTERLYGGFYLKEYHDSWKEIEPFKKENFSMVFITSAAFPTKCLHILGRPKNGKKVEIWDCPYNRQLTTKWLVPADKSKPGPIRPLESPDLCLENPKFHLLQLWKCEDVIKKRNRQPLEWRMRQENVSWLKCPHFDLPDKADKYNMSAENLDKVMNFVEEKDYAGFSIWHKRAWIKGLSALSKHDLHWMGYTNPVVFYLRRPHDFTVHFNSHPGLCLGAAMTKHGPPNGAKLGLHNCGNTEVKEKFSLAEATRFTMHTLTNAEEKLAKEKAKADAAAQAAEELRKEKEELKAEKEAAELEAERETEAAEKAEKEKEQAIINLPAHQVGIDTTLSPEEVAAGLHPTPPPPDVKVDMTLSSIDYSLLKEQPELMGKVQQIIKEEVARAAGHGIQTEHVSADLSPGSVKVASTVTIPDGVSQTSVEQQVQSSDLKQRIAERVANLIGIETVTTGYVAPEPSSGGPDLTWLWIILALCLCCPILCGVATVMNPRKGGNQSRNVLSQFKTREATVNIDACHVWRSGRIVDKNRTDQATYDIDLDSSGGGRQATLALVGYSPVSGTSTPAT